MAIKPDVYLSSHQVAGLLGVTTQTLYNWLRKGRVPEPNRNPITRYRLWTAKDVDRIRQLVTGGEPLDV